MAETDRKRTKGKKKFDDDAAAPTGHACNVAFCPIGLALSAVQPMQPDVVEHLLAASQEFLLAVRALLSARAEHTRADGGSPSFEKIDIA